MACEIKITYEKTSLVSVYVIGLLRGWTNKRYHRPSYMLGSLQPHTIMWPTAGSGIPVYLPSEEDRDDL